MAKPQPPQQQRQYLSRRSFFIGYLSFLLSILGSGMLTQLYLELEPHFVMLGCVGLLFIWAAIAHPRYIYLVVRNTGWFAHIQAETHLRCLLALLGTVLVVMALLSLCAR